MNHNPFQQLVLSALWLSVVTADNNHGRAALAKADIRHNIDTSSLELNVDARDTYNQKFMALMKSPCRPEYDGYFGATSGEPVQIQYGFQLETQPLSSIMDLLDVVEDKIVDAILTNEFPTMCGFRRQLSRKLSNVSGFRFLKFQEVEKCEPSANQVNFCGVFIGHISVYGKDAMEASLETLSLVDQILSVNDPKTLHPEIISILPADKYFAIKGEEVTLKNDNVIDFDTVIWAGIGIAVLLVLALFWWFCVRNEKQGDTAFSNNTRRNKRAWAGFSRRRQSQKEYDPEGKSLKPTFEPEAVAFGGGERLLLTDGRPVEIDFDKTYTDQTFAEQTLSESATLNTFELRSTQGIV